MITLGDEVLPTKAEATDRIHAFVGVNPETISDHVELARTLGGLSLAYSSVALDYGALPGHLPVGITENIGLWTRIGERDEHEFTVSPQDIFGDFGAKLWRSAVEGGTSRYYDFVSVPTTNVLSGFLDTEPGKLHNGWDMPSWTDIYALRTRGDSPVPTDEEFWPFHKPLETTPDGLTPQERIIGYTQILQDLSRTLLELE